MLVSHANIQLAGEIDNVLASHRALIGPASESERIAADLDVVQASSAGSQVHLLVRSDRAATPVPPGWEARPVTLEELTFAYLREGSAAALPGPPRRWDTEPPQVTR